MLNMVLGYISNARLCHVNTNDGEWNLDLTHNELLNSIVNDIISILSSSMKIGNDVVEIYCFRSISFIAGRHLNENLLNWKTIWRLDVVERV